MHLSKLFSRTSIGQIMEWSIEVIDDSYRTHEGIVDGKITTSSFTKCEGKNIGKKNETSSAEQALKEATAKHKKKKDSGYFENINDIDQNLFFEPMLAKKYEDHASEISFPIYSQPKLDGMRCTVNKEGMWSRNGKKIVSAPHIFEILKNIFETNPDLVFDGEIYNHQLKHNFNKIISLAKKTKPTDDDLIESSKLLEYHVYDIKEKDNLFFSKRFNLLSDQIKKLNNSKIVTVSTVTIQSKQQLDDIYAQYLNQGYEGQMIRKDAVYENKRTKSLLKRKEFLDEEFILLDVVDGKGNRSGLASACYFQTKSGESFQTGVIGNDDYCKLLFKDKTKFIGKKATVVYQNLTPDGAPRFGKMKIIRDFE